MALYEAVAASQPPESSIGEGDFDLIGTIELGILKDAGMNPDSFLFDFGCGTGRLAVHAVPYLSKGRYIGTDISATMLVHAAAIIRKKLGDVPANVRFERQLDESFPTADAPDFFCAFSVFTHMEHEDTYRYLRAAREISGSNTVFVASCLPVDLDAAKHYFLFSAGMTVDERWNDVRRVVTSRELFTFVAELAGWTVTSWHPGDKPVTTLPDGTTRRLGQSVAIMRPAD